MEVVILCGGMGTRLKEETEFRPKPMVAIGGRPILWHIMNIFSSYGFNSFILCLGFKGDVIKEYFLNYEYMNCDFTIDFENKKTVTIHNNKDVANNWKVTLADTGLETETGGRVSRIQKYITGKSFLMTYGDGLSDINIAKLIQYHKQKNKIATLTGFRPFSRFGSLEIDSNSLVQNFREKPRMEGYVSGGFFVFDKKIFDYLDDHCVLEQEPLMQLAKAQELAMFRHDGFWKSMDTYRDFLDLNRMWKEGDRPWTSGSSDTAEISV